MRGDSVCFPFSPRWWLRDCVAAHLEGGEKHLLELNWNKTWGKFHRAEWKYLSRFFGCFGFRFELSLPTWFCELKTFRFLPSSERKFFFVSETRVNEWNVDVINYLELLLWESEAGVVVGLEIHWNEGERKVFRLPLWEQKFFRRSLLGWCVETRAKAHISSESQRSTSIS